MGEYATYNGTRIKMGTCEELFYLRHEDRFKVRREKNSLDPATETGLYWRLPFPDEDALLPGNYRDHTRGFRLLRDIKPTTTYGQRTTEDFHDPETAASPGIVQLKSGYGMLVNVKCYHGERLPENSPDAAFHWNGKDHHLELRSVKNLPDGAVVPVVTCRACQTSWSYTWDEILPYVEHDQEMHRRLCKHAQESKTA